MKLPLAILLLLNLSLTTWHGAKAQSASKHDEKKEAVESMVKERNFIFVVQTILPTTGRNIPATSYYDMRISGDTVVTNLPYFGRAYIAPINPAAGGYSFTSTQFEYQVEERKKGGLYITIVPKDYDDVSQMYLSVSKNGYGTLQIVSNNRQPISYYGRLAQKPL